MFFKRKQSEPVSETKAAGAILLSDKIIIETKNKEGEHGWYTTDNISLLNVDISNAELGMTTLKHIHDSISHIPSIEERRQIRNSYRKKGRVTENSW